MISMFILSKVVLFCFWFCIGYFFYSNVLQSSLFINSRLKKVIDNLTLFQLILSLFMGYLIINLILTNFYGYFFSEYLEGLKIFKFYFSESYFAANSANVNSNPSSASTYYLGKVSEMAIMSFSLAGGIAVAKSAPIIGIKIATAAGTITIGGVAILVKNFAGYISEDLGRKSSYTNITDYLSEIFQLTGNSILDLLFLIQVFQKLQLLFIFFICYNSILLLINETKLEEVLLKLFPVNNVNYVKKIFKFLKKSAIITRFLLFILLIVSTLYSYYYLDFFISNFDGIVDLYISNKK